MKHSELKEALRLITKVASDPRVNSGQRDQLQKAKRELVTVERSGRQETDRVFRAIEIVTTVLLQIVES